MAAIIRGLLDFARRPGAEKSALDLEVLAQRAVALLQPIARKKGIDIELEAKRDGGGVAVIGNPIELEQVLANLVMNGIQAMSAGGTLHVRVSPRSADDADRPGALAPPTFACVEVEDEGVGIAIETLPKIFDPFFTTKEVGKGTGLGLSVSYGIVSDHGGRIQVSSALGSGTRFSVYLPLAGASPA
jgi:signal transduction histidine kinase